MNILAKGSSDQLNGDYYGYELYLEKEDIYDNFEETLEKSKKANIESVHIPHVKYDEYQKTIELCDELAQKLKASIVCHSSYVRPLMANKEFDYSVLDSEYGIENHWGLSVPQINISIFENKNHNLVLDVAHLYVTNPGMYQRNLSYILFEYSDQISQIHICDAICDEDHLDIGDGNIDMKRTLEKIIKSDYEGNIVVEVPVEQREKNIEKTKSLLSRIR
jgi:sugar phosphate isomerase/epimerase